MSKRIRWHKTCGDDFQKRNKFKTKNSKNTYCTIVITLTKSRKQYHKCESSFDFSEISFVIFLRLVSFSLADLRIAFDLANAVKSLEDSARSASISADLTSSVMSASSLLLFDFKSTNSVSRALFCHFFVKLSVS